MGIKERAFIDNVRRCIAKTTRHAVPTDWEDLAASCITSRGGRFRLLRNPRRGATDDQSVLLTLIHWHGGRTGGSLWGPLVSAQRLGSDRHRALDTLALLIRVAGGLAASPAADHWRAALGSDS